MVARSKTCTACAQSKPVSDFYRREASVDGFQAACKPCYDERRKRYHHARPDRVRGYKLKANFGITLTEYNAILCCQSGCCAICGSVKPWGRGTFHVDHDHTTGEVRGLLCHRCNTGIGLLRDDPSLLAVASEYVR